jgi:hypothetical protein
LPSLTVTARQHNTGVADSEDSSTEVAVTAAGDARHTPKKAEKGRQYSLDRCRARKEQLEVFDFHLEKEKPGQNLVSTIFCVPHHSTADPSREQIAQHALFQIGAMSCDERWLQLCSRVTAC